MSNPVLIPQSEGSRRSGAAATSASASAAQHIAGSEVFTSRVAEKIFEGKG